VENFVAGLSAPACSPFRWWRRVVRRSAAQGLGKVRACWFHEACDADQREQAGGMAAQRSVVPREQLTALTDSSPSTSACATAASATRTVLACGYRCVTDSIPLVAR
jgi:hypothetical protein